MQWSSCNGWFCLASTRKSQITTKDKVGNEISTLRVVAELRVKEHRNLSKKVK